MGFGMAKANLCLIACTQDFVKNRNPQGLWIHMLTITGLSLIAWGLSVGLELKAPISDAPWWQLMSASLGVLLGFMINGGCYFGSVSYLTQGNLNFLFTLLGIYIGERLTPLSTLTSNPPTGLQDSHSLSPVHEQLTQFVLTNVPGYLTMLMALGVLALLLISVHFLLKQNLREHQVRDRMFGVLLLIVSASVINIISPGWNYSQTISHVSRLEFGDWTVMQAAGVIVFLGALVANLQRGLMRVKPLVLKTILRCLLGGVVMDIAAQYIPGGSDAWLLWGIPRLAGHGLIAYGLAMGVLLLGGWLRKKYATA